ncbi:MAG: hypothetical protein QXG39_06420 [Candidatus Aenigmatarchaeota archaeon]
MYMVVKDLEKIIKEVETLGIDSTIRKLIDSYPSFKKDLEDMKTYAELAEKSAESCDYSDALSYLSNVETLIGIIGKEMRTVEDMMRLITVGTIVRSKLVDILKVKCGCKIK